MVDAEIQAKAIPDFEGIASKDVETGALLLEVQTVFQTKSCRELARIQTKQLTRLIVREARFENRKTGGQRPVHQIGFSETELILRLARSALECDGQRLAESEEIVRFIAQAHETSADSANASVETDRILALLFDLQADVNLRFGRARFYFGIF